MTPREVAENVEGSDGPTRVLASAIDADEHQLSEYHIYELVSDLGDDEIDDLMEELVLHGLGRWIREPPTYLGGERSLGWIRPTAAGRRRLQTASDEDQEARSVRGRIKRYVGAVVRASGTQRDSSRTYGPSAWWCSPCSPCCSAAATPEF